MKNRKLSNSLVKYLFKYKTALKVLKGSENTNKLTNTLVHTSATEEELFQIIVDAIQEKKGEKIIALDMRDIEEAVASFFIICDVQTGIQMAAIADNIEKRVREAIREKPYQFELGPTWTLVDYINIVVHIFQTEERKFYDLESLWMDAELIQL